MGGRDFADSKWNNAWQALRQPGSIFKPFVYLTALQQGYNAASILLDTPFVLDTGTSLWRPKNFSGRFRGPVTLSYALSRSINAPTAKLYLDFGLEPVMENVRRLGFTADLPQVPALFLGAGDVTLREVVGAYSTFANHGVRVDQYLVTRVETLDGEVLEQARIRQHEVLDPAEAYLMTGLLSTTLREGTGQSARWRGFTKTGAGKTGTTNESTNAWFCGYTPSFCAGVWVGFSEPLPMGRNATGAHQALPIWARFMGQVTDEKGDEPFVRPPAITENRVCLVSGLMATTACDSTAMESLPAREHPPDRVRRARRRRPGRPRGWTAASRPSTAPMTTTSSLGPPKARGSPLADACARFRRPASPPAGRVGHGIRAGAPAISGPLRRPRTRRRDHAQRPRRVTRRHPPAVALDGAGAPCEAAPRASAADRGAVRRGPVRQPVDPRAWSPGAAARRSMGAADRSGMGAGARGEAAASPRGRQRRSEQAMGLTSGRWCGRAAAIRGPG